MLSIVLSCEALRIYPLCSTIAAFEKLNGGAMNRHEQEQAFRRMAKAPMRATFIRVGDRVRLRDDPFGDKIPYARDGERYFVRPVIRSDMKGEVISFAFHTVGWLRNDNRPDRRPPGLYRDVQNVYVRFEDGQLLCVCASELIGLGGVWEARIEQAARASNGEWGLDDVDRFDDPNIPEPVLGERFADLPPTFLCEGDVVRPAGFREHVHPLSSYALAHPFDDPQWFRVGGIHFYRGRGNGLPGWEEVNNEPHIAVADRCYLFAWGGRNDSSHYTDQQCRLVERGPVWKEEHQQEQELTFHDLQEEANYRALKGQATEIGKSWYTLYRELQQSDEEVRAAEAQICSYEQALELVRRGEGHGVSLIYLSVAKASVEHYFALRYHDEDLATRIAKATLNENFLVHHNPRRG